MPARWRNQPPERTGEVIATFEGCQFIKTLDQKYELVGGSEADRAEARVWIAMFMPRAKVREG